MFKQILITLALCFVACAQAAAQNAPFNRIVIVIDSSGSYQTREAEAIAMANQLLQAMATRERRHWEASDEVRIVTLDALPETVWSGTAAQLSNEDAGTWSQRFAGRGDFSNCTNVKAALERAVAELNAGPAPEAKYLFIYSDLINEPPVASLSSCASRQATLGDDFDYASLRDVQIAAFWLPASQKWAWDSALRAHGLTSFRLYSDSESAAIDAIEIPPRAVHETTSAERQAAISRLQSLGGAIATYTVGGIAVIVLLILLVAVLRRGRRPRRRAVAATRHPIRNQNGGAR